VIGQVHDGPNIVGQYLLFRQNSRTGIPYDELITMEYGVLAGRPG